METRSPSRTRSGLAMGVERKKSGSRPQEATLMEKIQFHMAKLVFTKETRGQARSGSKIAETGS